MPPVFVSEDDFLLQNYTYELPQEQIAQYPPEQRGTSRLLTMRRNGALDLEHHMFSDLPDCLPEGALLVANNSRVLQAPLPPYIKRSDAEEDFSRYQTIYSREEKTGSVAAPTAGLHFTDELRETLRRRGFQWAEVTLYVGYGTFSPVRCEDIRNHQMHREYVELPEETANAIAEAKARHRPVIAVGTTSVRTLEGVAQVCGRAQPFAGWTDIFLYPGRPFRVVDGIITNFHLPESSLLMLVSAFAGRKRILEAYQEAVKEGYRFFSYGDAMLIR